MAGNAGRAGRFLAADGGVTYFLVMTRHVSVAEAKARFSALLAAVEGGEAVTITRHGRPVAILNAAPGRGVRQPGKLKGNPDWDGFVMPDDLFRPMTDGEARTEGWP